jgi:hypothetical protein
MAVAMRFGVISTGTAAFLLLTIPLIYIIGRNRAATRHDCKRAA